MKPKFVCFVILSFVVTIFSVSIFAQGSYSFETTVPSEWNQISNGALSISNTRFKDSLKSLKWEWLPNSMITVTNPKNLSSINPSTGGIYFWLYNESPQNDSLRVEFLNVNNAVACSFRMYLNFKGWRCAWVSFKGDMKYNSSTRLGTMKLYAPASKTGTGSLYFDMFEVQTSPVWSRTADFFVNITSSSVADDYVIPRKITPTFISKPLSDTIQLNLIAQKLDAWMVDTSRISPDPNNYQNQRISAVQSRINQAKGTNSPLRHFKFIRNTTDNTVIAIDSVTGLGKGLFGTAESNRSPRINDFAAGACLQLALDFRINKNTRSLQRCIDLFDWMYDQGWADSSAMGSLYLQQVRTTAWPQAFFLLRDVLPESTYKNAMNALYWHLQFGDSYLTFSPNMASASADFIRGLGIAKLVYALCVKDPVQRLSNFSITRDFLEKTSLPYSGFSGVYKTDFSTYHHSGPYVSEYGDDALHQSSLIYYLFDESTYKLNDAVYNQLRNTWLRYDFFSANLKVPFAISGRGPGGSAMSEHLQAFPYLILTQKGKTDTELIASYKRLVNVNPTALNSTINNAGVGISYTTSVGAAKGIVSVLNIPTTANNDPNGTVFMPYSGLFLGRNKGWLAAARGFSKYMYDFEVISNEGRYSRYLSYGSVQISSSIYKNDNFTPDSSYDWIHIPATTSKFLPLASIDAANSSNYWRFSDQTFLGGLKLNDSTGAFSVNLHDITFDTSFRAKKTMFYFGDMLYFMGSNITCKDATNPIHTTLFQNKRTTGLTNLFVNNQDVTNIGYTASSVNATTVIKDGLNNVYVVFPNASQGISVQKQMQSGFTSNGTATPTKEYDIAYINHGTSVSNESYRYAIMFQPQNIQVNAIAADTVVNVLQQDDNAHIAYHRERKTFGFAFFNRVSNVNKGIINRVYHPCIVMQQDNDDSSKTISFTDPDLRSPNFNKNNLQIDSLDINGKFAIKNTSDVGITLKYPSVGVTRLYFPTIEGFDYKVQLVPTNVNTVSFTPGNLAILRVSTPTSTGVPVYIDEYTTNGVFVRSTLIEGLHQPNANTSTEEGFLTLSGNGEYLGLTGYERTSSQGLYTSRFDTLNRVAALVKYDGSVIKRNILPDFDLSKSFYPKSVYTYDGKEIWVGYGHLSGNYGGIMHGNLNSTISPLALKSVTKWRTGFSVRQLNYNPADQLLYFGSGSSRLNYFNNNILPTDSTDATAVPSSLSMISKSGAKGFSFIEKDSVQLLYVAITNTSGPGIIKYRKDLITNTWDSIGAYGLATDSYFSLTASTNTNNVILYIIRKSVNANSKSELAAVTDSWTGNMSAASENVLIASASASSQVFRGISLVPVLTPVVLLPLHLTSFTGKVNTNNVVLSWATRGEKNLADFEIEKRLSGGDYITIGKMSANNSVASKNYSFIDPKALIATTNYRLKMLDKDGSYSYSNELSFVPSKQTEFSIYPNPASNVLNIEFSPLIQNATAEVFDFSGKKRIQKTLYENSTFTQLNISSLSSGTYLLRIYNGIKTINQLFIKK